MSAAIGGTTAFFLHHSMVVGVSLTAAVGGILLFLTIVHSSGHRLGSRLVQVATGVVTVTLLGAFVADVVGRYLALS